MSSVHTRNPWPWATAATCLIAFAWMQWVAINNWLIGRWYLADVGNVQGILLNTLHGRFMYSPMTEGQHYAYHFTPLLTLLSPLALLSKYPIPIITTYNLALALCPWPLYVLARQRGLHGALAWAIGVLFVGNQFVGSVQLAYHFESWMILFLLATMTLFATPRRAWFWASALLTLMVKEDAAVWLGAWAAYALWVHWLTPLRTRAARLLILCAVYAVIGAAVMWWSARGQDGNALFYVQRTGGFAMGWDTMRTAALLAGSVGGLCVLAGRSSLLLLVTLPLILSHFEMTRHLLYYYSYPVLPFLFYATVVGTSRLVGWMGVAQHAKIRILALFICALGLAQAFLPTRTDRYRRWPAEVTPRHEYRLRVAREVLPPNTRTAVQFGLWGITPSRPEAYALTADNLTSETYVFLDLKAPYGMPPAEYLQLVRPLFAQAEAGKRPLLHDRDEIYILGPAAR